MDFDSSEFCSVGEVKGERRSFGEVVLIEHNPSPNAEGIYPHSLEISEQFALFSPPDKNRRCAP